jgi:hypothetical protein
VESDRHLAQHLEADFARGATVAEFVTPISRAWRDMEVFQCPPNGSGLIVLMILGMIEKLGTVERGFLSAERAHLHIEAARLAYRDRDAFLADPSQVEVPVGRLTSDGYLEKLAKLITGDKALAELIPGTEDYFYYNCLQTLRKMAVVTDHLNDVPLIDRKLRAIESTFDSLYWKDGYFMSNQVTSPDDRANAMAVNCGLASRDKWESIFQKVLSQKTYSSCFFDRWVFEAMCKMDKPDQALLRMATRYKTMIPATQTTLWEHYDRWWASYIDAFDEGFLNPIARICLHMGRHNLLEENHSFGIRGKALSLIIGL